MKNVYPFRFALVCSLFALLCIQCKESPKTESAADPGTAEMADAGAVTMEGVIAVHDEVMPKMKEISRLVAELKPMADSTEAGAPYLKAMTDLQGAYSSMMEWMRGFGDRFDHEEINQGKALTPEKQAWLEEEDVKVKAMRDEVEGSIAAAREVLGKE